MKTSMTRLDSLPEPRSRSLKRRLLRAVLILVGLMGVVVVPAVACWKTLEGHEASAVRKDFGSAEPALPDLSNLEDAVLQAYIQLQSADIQGPASDDPSVVTFSVLPGETAVQISERLEDEGLVRNANLFRILLRLRGLDTALEAGDYQLRRNMNMDEIMSTLQHGQPPTVILTVPEGWRVEQVADLLRANGLADADEFLRLAREGGGFDYAFLSDRPEGVTSLEGYLFPDTYKFAADATAEDVIARMLTTFGERFTPEMREQAKSRGLSIHQVVTLASIVEREAQVPDERMLIAGVFYNRIADGMHLNADPTVQYALGYQADAGQWWKRPLYLEDLEVDSPYNTYKYMGLPPGPICNPGLASLLAATEPADTDYYYFVANDVAGDGSHIFAKTLEEHRANIDKYRP